MTVTSASGRSEVAIVDRFNAEPSRGRPPRNPRPMPLRGLWHLYTRNLAARPARTKATTSCLTFCTTDSIAQYRERRNGSTQQQQRHDIVRTAKHGCFGLLWLGPMNHMFWSRTPIVGLDYWIPGSSWGSVFARVFVDQVTLMPLNMLVFLSWPHLWRGDLEMAQRSVRENFYSSFTFALSVWPFVHPLSFKYVPLEHRLLVLNVCSLGVFSYASYVRECSGTAGSDSSSSSSSSQEGARLKRLPTDPGAVAAAA